MSTRTSTGSPSSASVREQIQSRKEMPSPPADLLEFENVLSRIERKLVSASLGSFDYNPSICLSVESNGSSRAGSARAAFFFAIMTPYFFGEQSVDADTSRLGLLSLRRLEHFGLRIAILC